MKTIEQRAEERAKEYNPNVLERQVDYMHGYKQAVKDITEWNKPNVPPKPNVHVLIKYEKPIVKTDNDIAYAIGYCEFGDYWRFVDQKYHQALDTFGYKFVGWRYIHE